MMVRRNRSCTVQQQDKCPNVNRTSILIAGWGLVFAPFLAVHAQGPAPTSASETAPGLEEVIVTARRKNELLQDVPQTVTPVTAAQLENYNFQDLKDISQVVPSLQIVPGGNRSLDSNSFRGVSFQPATGTQNTLGFYINDTFVTNNFVTTSLFDVGQIELLSGPQGTLRGEPSPSGSLTITTRRPDLENFGGYVTGTAETYGQTNANAAVNLPIIAGKLAVRVSGLEDDNDLDGVDSVNSSYHPYSHTYAGRISVRAEPIDAIETNLVYQNMYWQQAQFAQVAGPGAPGGVNPNAPANYDGPPLTAQDFRGTAAVPNTLWNHSDIWMGQIDWHLPSSQKLSYNGSYWKYADNNGNGALTGNAGQIPGMTGLNNIPRVPEQFDTPSTTQRVQTHELRISSETPAWGFMDYTAGAFFKHTQNEVEVVQLASFLPGSFGSPLGLPNPFIYNNQYTLQLQINSPSEEKETSEFANLTFHLPKDTELSIGGRHISYSKNGSIEGTLLPDGVFAALPPAALGLPAGTPCSALHAGSTYPGTCDLPASLILGGHLTALPFTPQNLEDNTWIYNVSLSHKLTPDLLIYANVGSSWRPGAAAVGINNAANDPTLAALQQVKSESSVDYETGFKWSFLENRGRLNVGYFHQKFENFIFNGVPVQYLADNGAQTTLSQFSFTSNPDAVLNGVNVDTGFKITRQWSVDLNATYTNGHLTGSQIPCNPPGGSFPPTAPPPYIFLCGSDASISIAPNFSSSLTTDYYVPITSRIEAFVRGLYSYYGRNSNVDTVYVAPAYGILNLYAGLRSPDGAWQGSIFAKNALNAKPQLSSGIGNPAIDVGGVSGMFGSSGYFGTSIAPRQELGVTFTYSFGSR
jgi:iron complex outermembrane receptor protein